MADDTRDDTHRNGHGGSASSWLAVTVILLGFTIGGVALCLGPNWFLLWMGVIVSALGGILLVAFRVFHDVVLEAPRAPHGSREKGILR
ncbi:HGxxPAAW family protein [Streptosporangium lutulentum]|uniref:Fatty acid desaturase n=1 Tax=Streptosporangium lutulentum TaxID=1461250 RepID=A0ABT9QI50_9ACTN|nr:HGxxPAAW family protein [Streptosporangium lutulentum]MDP9846430.1 fatty acid desaturase [Streptosporangium lutulentum]